jgi:hypothetical protein
MPASAVNFHIHQTWIKPAECPPPANASEWSDRRQKLIGSLRERVFGWFPKGNLPYRTRRLIGSGGYAGQLAEFGDFEFDSEPGVPLRAMVLRAKSPAAPLLVWVRRPSEQVGFPGLDELLPILPQTSIIILSPRFSDRLLPATEYSRIERTAALSGRTVAAMRVWDVLRTITWAGSALGIPAENAEVFGRGEAGVIGLYAALLEARVGHVVVSGLPPSHRQGPALLAILRQTDIPEVAAALAPRRLSVLGPSKQSFDLPREVYRLAGASGQFSLKASLPEAILEARAEGHQQMAAAGRGGAPC